MTPTDLKLIRSSFAEAASDPWSFAAVFRQRAVALDPSLAGLLRPMDRERAAGFVAMVDQILAGLDAGECTGAKAQAVALRHRWTGIQPRHYAAVGQALLDALATQIGKARFGDDARAAWAAAFVLTAEAVMARCYNPLDLVA